ncbi:hypothetical protein ACROYT_G027444 [Oculina patagonica]
MWGMRTETIPVIIGALGAIKKGLESYIGRIPGQISISELQKITLLEGWTILRNDLHLGRSIEKGEFVDVFQAEYRGQKVCVKSPSDSKHVRKLLLEAAIMTHLKHTNLEKLLGVSMDDKLFQIVTEFCGNERCSSSSSPDSKTPPAKSVRIMHSTSDSSEMADMREILTQIQDNTNKLLEDNQTLRKQYADLHESLSFHIAEVEKLVKENRTLKKEVKSLKANLKEVEEDNETMAEDLATAINKIDDVKQYSRKHNLEFHGIPESSQENLAEQIIKLGNVLNVPIRNNDIDICHRLSANKKSNKPRPIIARFKSYEAKKALYSARKQLKNQSLNHVFPGADVVYINENLTRRRRDLFNKVWKAKKLNHWHSVWTVDGKVFFKISVDDAPERIYSLEDLDNF